MGSERTDPPPALGSKGTDPRTLLPFASPPPSLTNARTRIQPGVGKPKEERGGGRESGEGKGRERVEKGGEQSSSRETTGMAASIFFCASSCFIKSEMRLCFSWPLTSHLVYSACRISVEGSWL